MSCYLGKDNRTFVLIQDYAEERIRQVQNGEWPDRSLFPYQMKGQLAKSYGMTRSLAAAWNTAICWPCWI